MQSHSIMIYYFFFNDTATTEIYTLSLHDALPISRPGWLGAARQRTDHPRRRRRPRDSGGGARPATGALRPRSGRRPNRDRKSTRLNSSHANISYAVFCLKKKNNHGSVIAEFSAPL